MSYIGNSTSTQTATPTDGSVTTPKIVSDAVTTAKIANAAVTVAKLAASGLNASALTTGTLPKAQLPAGSVLQIVNSGTSTTVASTSNTRANTTLSATITPTSTTSKILVFVHQVDLQISQISCGMGIWLMRDTVDLAQIEPFVGYGGTTNYPGGTGITYLDAPSTTSPVTYKTQFNVSVNSGPVRVQGNGGRSSITLMEIAA